jgi:hypothetical protein
VSEALQGASASARDATVVACIVASAAAFGAMAILARIAYAAGVDIATLLALRFAPRPICRVHTRDLLTDKL